MLKSLVLTALLCAQTVSYGQSSTLAYNTFLETPQRFDQISGFGYVGGMQGTSRIFGNSFIPSATGIISDVWIAIGSPMSDVGTDIVNLYIASSGSQKEPTSLLASVVIKGELSKRESVVHVSVADQHAPITQGQMYWMLVSPGSGTDVVGWLGGPPNDPPSAFAAYPDSSSSTGWFIAPFNANGAMRIDVSAIPEPTTYQFMLIGILGAIFATRQRRTPA